jgi:hypothetical protein
MTTKSHKSSRRRAADEQPDEHAPSPLTITSRQQQAPQALLTGAIDAEAAEIAHLAQEAEVDLPDAAPSMYAPMTWDHVRTLEGQGMTFGPHSVSHPILSRIQAESAVREITESWRRVREEARSPVPIFCYPNGCDADYGDREVAALRDLGFVGALSAEGGFADPASFREGGDGPFRTKRLPFPEELSHLAQYVTGIERFSRIVRGLEI